MENVKFRVEFLNENDNKATSEIVAKALLFIEDCQNSGKLSEKQADTLTASIANENPVVLGFVKAFGNDQGKFVSKCVCASLIK